MNSHGNNFHPDLPACVSCAKTAWRTNDTYMGHGIQVFYSCDTPNCDGRGMVIYLSLGLLVLFDAPLIDAQYRVPVEAMTWIREARRLLGEADINACTHAGKAPPATIQLPAVPSLDRVAFFTAGDGDTWTRGESGEIIDLAAPFKAKVNASGR